MSIFSPISKRPSIPQSSHPSSLQYDAPLFLYATPLATHPESTQDSRLKTTLGSCTTVPYKHRTVPQPFQNISLLLLLDETAKLGVQTSYNSYKLS
ncbi:hypothetical protein BOTCAL_0438g00060 [Botryotinia calthae]|uniref:Uncharacterized protein n=1 Tax=Botryotinia calthae TaxID=38488 RepID=A0A4Y8CPA8_9HELO|nr:hypothetical protein BOTCAL_0438g00060 [Botryotinia calthae]